MINSLRPLKIDGTHSRLCSMHRVNIQQQGMAGCIFSDKNCCILQINVCYTFKHTSYLSRASRVCPCKFFLAGVNFYIFNAKNWHFRQILREKVAIFTDLTRKIGIFDRFYAKKWRFFTDLARKIGVFWCKFYSPKILPV